MTRECFRVGIELDSLIRLKHYRLRFFKSEQWSIGYFSDMRSPSRGCPLELNWHGINGIRTKKLSIAWVASIQELDSDIGITSVNDIVKDTHYKILCSQLPSDDWYYGTFVEISSPDYLKWLDDSGFEYQVTRHSVHEIWTV